MTKERIIKELRNVKYVRLVADEKLNDLKNGLTYVEIDTDEFVASAMLQIELYNLSKIKSLYIDFFVVSPKITEYSNEYFVFGAIEIEIVLNVPKTSCVYNRRKEKVSFGCFVKKEN